MQRKLIVALTAAVIMAIPGLVIAAMAGKDTVNSTSIVDYSIASVDIANKAVTNAKLFGNISGSKLANGAITGAKMAAGTVTATQLANGAVTTAKLFGNISGSKLANGTVTGAKMAIGTVTATQLANGAVTSAKLGFSCTSGQILQFNGSSWACSAGTPGPVGPQGEKGDTGPQGPPGIISEGAVTTNTIADGAVTAAKIAGAIGTDKLSSYAGIKIVHLGPADGINTFNSINSALTAIGTMADRYAIYVMPGVYSDDINLLGMTSNVDIIGASRAGTIIRPTVNYLIMGTGLFLKNLTVEGRVYFSSPFYGGRDDDATSAGISNCTVRTTGTSLIYDHLGAVYMSMNANNISIEDSFIDSGYSGVRVDEVYYPDTITLKNLTIRIATPNYKNFGVFGSTYGRYAPVTGNLKITNVDVQGTGDIAIALYSGSYVLDNVKVSNMSDSNGWYSGLYLNSGSIVKIVNSKIQVPGTYAVGTNSGEIQIDNSTIQGKITHSASTIKIGNSKLAGVQLIGSTIKIVNSYDSNYDPIQNGTYGNLLIP